MLKNNNFYKTNFDIKTEIRNIVTYGRSAKQSRRKINFTFITSICVVAVMNRKRYTESILEEEEQSVILSDNAIFKTNYGSQ